MKLLRSLAAATALAVLALALPSLSAGQGRDAVVGTPATRLAGYLDGLKSFDARFHQTLRDARGRVTEEAVGRLYLDKPGRFRWEYAEPNEQLIVSDGKNLWLFDVDLEQVTVKPLDASLAATPASLLAGQTRVQEGFSIEPAPAADGLEWFVLTPRRVDTDFTRLRLGLERGILKVMELQDKLQQRTTIEFSDARRNPQLPGSLFAFEPPADVDVIGTPRR